jgi:hypothetical protein
VQCTEGTNRELCAAASVQTVVFVVVVPFSLPAETSVYSRKTALLFLHSV